MKLLKKLALSLLVLGFIFSCSPAVEESALVASADNAVSRATYTDYRAPSQDPPGGLLPTDVPQFVILGFDDNQFSDGMHNSMDTLKNKWNPEGTLNPATFDAMPLAASFYNTPGGRDAEWDWTVGGDTVASWNTAWRRGHEIGNHTYYHEHGLQFSQARWVEELTRCNDFLTGTVGVPANEIVGFRTPFLEYNDNTFSALQQVGIEYDCSFEAGWIYWPAEDGSTLLWPFTMDDGKPAGEDGRNFGSHPGLWQIPDHVIFFPDGSRTTGFDYNLWFSKSTTKTQFVDALKYSLNQKYSGNRSPMSVGLHTNYYSQQGEDEMKIYDPASIAKLKATLAERIAGLEEFVDYALTLPDVRIVSAAQALTWLKNPVPLRGAGSPQVTITTNVGANGSLDPAGPAGTFKAYTGSDLKFTIQPLKGYKTASVTVDGVALAPIDYAGNKFDILNVQGPHSVDVTFEALPPGEEYTMTYYWTFDPAQEPVDPSGVMVDLQTLTGEVIATVDENLAKRYSMEGSGFLPDGRLINLHNSSDWPGARFLVVDQTFAPWGLDAQEGPLVLFESIAVDPNVIPLNTPVYIAEWDGVLLPDGQTIHDGWFIAKDTSHSFSGKWIDVFVGTYDNYMYMEGALNGIETCTVSLGNVVTHDITATHNVGGKILPSGVVPVVEGTDKKFVIEVNPGYKIASVTADGVLQTPVPTEYTFTNVTGPHTLDVVFEQLPVQFFDITPSAGAGGTISPDVVTPVMQGANQVFSFTPDNGKMVGDVTITTASGSTVISDGATSYTFIDVQEAASINVTFVDEPVCIYPDWDSTAVYTGGDIVHHNGHDWYAKWWTQGNEPGTNDVWRDEGVCGPPPVSYTITSSAGANGSISPLGATSVEQGQSQTYTMSSAVGYAVEDVLVDSVSVGPVSSYTFSNVTADHTISVTFKVVPIVYHTITATAGANGSIDPAGAVDVVEGQNQTFNFSAATGYKVADVVVDGVSKGASASYTFTNVTAAHTISVSFVEGPSVPEWDPNGVEYALNAEVSHNGKIWVCKYAHVSNSAWVPGTPGLWIWEEKI